MGACLSFYHQLESVTCCRCGVEFAMPVHLLQKLREDSTRMFFCPNGHNQHFTVTTADQLRKELAAKEQELAREREQTAFARRTADSASRSAAIHRGRYRALKERVANGVCPCCHRHFANLQRHVATKHPKWKGSEVSG